MKFIGIIPARYESSRFPGKPLVDIMGKSMIQRVYEQALKCESLDAVIVATDDTRVQQHVLAFGGKVVMTSSAHQSGTDRCAEVMEELTAYDVAINIQGDEPFIDPSQIERLCNLFDKAEVKIGTLIKRIDNTDELFDENVAKIVINAKQQALYFSRQAIPYQRGMGTENWLDNQAYYKHIGIYGYRADTLKEITKLPVSAYERTEALEQLRWLEHGYTIDVAETDLETISVDSPDDLDLLLKKYR